MNDFLEAYGLLRAVEFLTFSLKNSMRTNHTLPEIVQKERKFAVPRSRIIINPLRMREGYSSHFVILSVCLSVTTILEPGAITKLELQSQRYLHATLKCLISVDF